MFIGRVELSEAAPAGHAGDAVPAAPEQDRCVLLSLLLLSFILVSLEYYYYYYYYYHYYYDY